MTVREDIPKVYEPAVRERRWYAWWRERDLFRPEVNEDGEPYTIVIPPPNVTGALHIGHALNAVVQDMYIRRARMQGRRALWLYGIDHAGIATQNVVERELARTGRTREAIGREAFEAEVWKWKEAYGDRIADQLAALGGSCDWSRARFTLDPGLSLAVRRAFVSLYSKDLIYRGKYIINWCPHCRTALSDEEVEHVETAGKLYHIAYPLEGGGEIEVATTRPETMLGDTGVAINPEDERHRDLLGRVARLPLLHRPLPIVADEFVDPEFGTGLVKVTPAHDPNDFWIARRHDLPAVSIFDGSARTNEAAGPYAGLDRYDARERVLADLRSANLLRSVQDHTLSIGHCYRCDTVVEPMLSDQWFVRMKPLAEPALEAVRKGEVRLHPERWVKVYENWLENIHDWCISRQLWWGHRIPVWTCIPAGHVTVAEIDPVACEVCGSGELVQDEDVLDTWFSSALWPFSTLGWPQETEDFRRHYPTNLLVSGPDILFFWIARMIMFGIEFTGNVPFFDVHLTGIVRDPEGRKMSKSAGNTLDPVELIESYGADALRFTLMFSAASGTDLALAREKVETGRNFANKLWNASRFVLLNLGDDFTAGPLEDVDEDRLDLADRWILTRLDEVWNAVDDAFRDFRPNDVANLVFDFVKHDYCDWYVEWSKVRLASTHPVRPSGGKAWVDENSLQAVSGGDSETVLHVRRLLVGILESALRLLHPLMPFLTEEIWQRLPLPPRPADSIMLAEWAHPKLPGRIDAERDGAVAGMLSLQALVGAIREMRQDLKIPPAKRPTVIVVSPQDSVRERITAYREPIMRLAAAGELVVRKSAEKPPAAASAVLPDLEIFMPLEGLIDLESEKQKLEREYDRVEKLLTATTRRLGSQEFRERAPRDVVKREEEKQSELRNLLERLERNLAAIR
jgi:valyl-tRNA synthetase